MKNVFHNQFIKISTVFLHRILRQGVDLSDFKKVLVKMINRHILQFEKYNTNYRDLIQQLLCNFLMLFLFKMCMYVYNLYVIGVYVCVWQF